MENTFLCEGLADWLSSGALLSEPGSPDQELWIGWGLATRTASENAATFFAPDFFLKDRNPNWTFERYSRVRAEPLAEALKSFARPATLPWVESEPAAFQTAFDELTVRFRQGTLAKAVPVIFDRAQWPREHSRSELRAHWILNALTYGAKAPVYLYGVWDETNGILGATPELLVRREEKYRWTTMALAGTRRDADRATLPTLLDDPKERREHQLVIDGVRQALEPYGTVHVGETMEFPLPGLSHLRTHVDLATAESVGLAELVKALHPTPALGAFPREAWTDILERLDERSPRKRHRFGAPFGFVSPDHSTALAVVAIRNLQWDADEIVAAAGCGVIAESHRDREWLELRAKLAAVRRIFGA